MVDESFVHNLCTSLGRDIAAEIDIQLASDLQVCRGPGISHRIEQVHPSASGNRDEGIGLSCLAIGFERFKMHANQSTYNFEMAQFFRPYIHQEVAPSDIVYTVPPLNGVLHRRGEF